jgi:hypothetical protein
MAIMCAAAGCWGQRKTSPIEPAAPAMLHVENRHWLDVDIYVVQSGHRSRLGTVTAAATKDFRFPRSTTLEPAPLQLLAAPIGSPATLMTESIVLKPGTQVDWMLESNLSTSTLSVY